MPPKAKYQAKQRCLSVIISTFADKPTGWLVTFKHNEKGDERQVEMQVDRGEWERQADTLDDYVKALTWLAHKLWNEMEARNG